MEDLQACFADLQHILTNFMPELRVIYCYVENLVKFMHSVLSISSRTTKRPGEFRGKDFCCFLVFTIWILWVIFS